MRSCLKSSKWRLYATPEKLRPQTKPDIPVRNRISRSFPPWIDLVSGCGKKNKWLHWLMEEMNRCVQASLGDLHWTDANSISTIYERCHIDAIIISEIGCGWFLISFHVPSNRRRNKKQPMFILEIILLILSNSIELLFDVIYSRRTVLFQFPRHISSCPLLEYSREKYNLITAACLPSSFRRVWHSPVNKICNKANHPAFRTFVENRCSCSGICSHHAHKGLTHRAPKLATPLWSVYPLPPLLAAILQKQINVEQWVGEVTARSAVQGVIRCISRMCDRQPPGSLIFFSISIFRQQTAQNRSMLRVRCVFLNIDNQEGGCLWSERNIDDLKIKPIQPTLSA